MESFDKKRLEQEIWERAIAIISDRFLGRGFPGGGISDLDDLDRNTQNLCADALRKEMNKWKN